MAVNLIASGGEFYRRGRLILPPPTARRGAREETDWDYRVYGECWVRNWQEDVSLIDLGAKAHQGFLVKGGL